MNTTQASNKGYAFALIIGAIGGGLLVGIATKAIPSIMSAMMQKMMQNMMAQMRQNAANPGET